MEWQIAWILFFWFRFSGCGEIQRVWVSLRSDACTGGNMFLSQEVRSKRRLHGTGKGRVVQTYRVVPPEDYYPATRRIYFEKSVLRKKNWLYFPENIRTTYDSREDFFRPWKSEFARRPGTGEMLRDEGEKTEWSALPSLQVSEAGDLALENSPDRKRVLYAAPERINESNRKLRRKAAPVNLLARPDVALAVPDRGGVLHFLQLAVPELSGHPDDFLAVTADCSAFALHVLGSALADTVAVVLQRFDNEEKDVFSKRLEDLEKFSSELYIKSRARSTYNLEEITSSIRLSKALNQWSYFHSSEDQSFKMRRLGIERYALPDVGEFYRIMAPYLGYRSGPNIKRSEKVQEFLSRVYRSLFDADVGPEKVMATEPEVFTELIWNMHNAAVIAQSGDDRVTIENTPFSVKLRTDFLGMVNQFLLATEHMKEELEKFCLDRGEGVPVELWERQDFFEAFLEKSLMESGRVKRYWQRNMRELLQEYQSLKGYPEGNLWSLQMYGMKSGQSFYEQMKDSVYGQGSVIRISTEESDILKAQDNLLRDFMAHNLNQLPLESLLPEINEELSEVNMWYPALVEECRQRMKAAHTLEEKRTVMNFHDDQLEALTQGLSRRVFGKFLEVYGFQQDGLDNMGHCDFFIGVHEAGKEMSDEDKVVAVSLKKLLSRIVQLREICA
ncbi:MAG: hypothetical protein MI784_13100 [Cytophagales bacterium]|nr:hypothetical protein [Cytophagales bacterium]